MPDRFEKTIELTAPIERVWRALTDYREFGTWFRVRLDGPFVLGAVTTGQMTYPGAEHMRWVSRVVRLEPPHVFAFAWPYSEQPGPDFSAEATILVTFSLETTETGTRLTVVESGFDALPENDRITALRDSERGWAEQMGFIQAHVEQ